MHFVQFLGGDFVFSDNYVNLCAAKKEAITSAAENMGFSRTTGLKWANGSVPRRTTLKIIADYFGVTVDALLEDKENPATNESDGVSPIKQKAIQHITEAIMEASEEDAELIIQMVNVLQKRNNPADNGGAGT